MFDYAQPLLNARKNLKELEEALLEKDYEKAFNLAIDVEARNDEVEELRMEEDAGLTG